jgi:hypothetical protein
MPESKSEGELNMEVQLDGVEPNPIDSYAMEAHFSIEEVAKRWGLHQDTIRKYFRDEPGVIVISGGKQQRNRTMRIPESVVLRVHQRITQQ